MSTLKVDSLTNNGSAVDLPNGAFQIGGKSILQGYTESASEPSSPTKGDLWWDTGNEKLYQYLNGEFKEIGIIPAEWNLNLSSASYDNVSFSIASQGTIVVSINFNLDGTKMYALAGSNNSAHQYSLSTGFDISTASYDNVSFSFSSQDANPRSATFSADGTKMYMAGLVNDRVYQYSLSTGFDLSTASYDNVSLSVASQEPSVFGLTFSKDGTKMYISGDTTTNIYQYTLATAFDLSTASYDSVAFNTSSQDGKAFDVQFNPQGTEMYIYGFANNAIYQYVLTSAFDISTASYNNSSFSTASQETSGCGLQFNATGTKMYIVGFGNNTVYQYSTGL